MMPASNPADWAVVAPNDDTGFGRQAEALKRVLGVGWHFIVPSDHLDNKVPTQHQERILPPDADDETLSGLLQLVKGVIFFERPDWHPSLLPLSASLGIASVCCPNWEWFRGQDPRWKYCDRFVCTSKFTENIVRQFGFTNTFFVGAWPLDLSMFPERRVRGPARHFIHNAGLVDKQDRKATRDTIRAFKRVKRSDLKLTVRLQKQARLPSLDERISLEIGNLEDPADLYKAGDVAIQPSKMEGNGFMVLEPVLCGIPTLTLDYPPMNEYVTDQRMLVRKRWFKRRAFPSAWVPHAHLRLPSIRDLSRRIAWCADNSLDEISNANRSWGLENFDRQHLIKTWRRALAGLVRS